ncbi:MAG: ComEC family competence protein [Alphaproteobacteria bacterium]|nr:ComEC family competence protein [Alphaproteobacteria bacterium]
MKEILDNQYKNLFLWTPFLVAFGAGLYFSLDSEPVFQFPILITLLLTALIFKTKNVVIRAFALFFFGFFYSMSFTHILNTPQIQNPFGEVKISGTVMDIDFSDEKDHIILNIPMNQINDKYDSNKNVNIRVSISNPDNAININDTISGTAMIFKPSPKSAPESFDFARWAYFKNISGTGFFKDYKIINSSNTNNLRTYIHHQSDSNLTDSLILGYKKSIPTTERKIWQSVGLGHVWSISGFHMTLISGWLFALFYFLFRLIAPISKRMPARYPALFCAWLGLLGYLIISGINVATIRAFFMTTFIFIAFILGRGILSLRNAAIVFLIIFLINPFFVMSAGFQLSFAAVFGLLWMFQNHTYVKRDFWHKIKHVLYIATITTITATVFTLPFTITHFGFIPLYSIIGNLIILPIFSVMIMPIVMIGTVLALFDIHFLLNFADHIYRFALHIAEHITKLPYANINMPNISNTVLILCIISILCLILIVAFDSGNFIKRNLNRVCAGTVFGVAIIIFACSNRPLVYSSEDHQLIGFVTNGELQFNKSRSAQHYFAFNTWRQINNEHPQDKNKRYKCNHGLCMYKTDKWQLAYMQNFTALLDNFDKICDDKSVNYIITVFDVDAPNCHEKILTNGILIYPSGKTVTFSNLRPWHMKP